MTPDFNAWLGSDACRILLTSCAAQVLARARRNTVDLAHLFQEELSNEPGALAQVVTGQLWLFLRGKPDSITAVAGELLARGDLPGFITTVADRFLADCIETRRTYAVNPYYAYYRRLRTVLSQSGEVFFTATRRGSYFAYPTLPDPPLLPPDQWGESYREWPHPGIPFKEVLEEDNKPALLKISRCYWDESVVQLMAEYLLPVKELNRFLFAKYPLGRGIDNEASLATDAGAPALEDLRATDPVDSFGYRARQTPRLDADLIEESLEDLARDCLTELTERQRLILLRAEAGATLDEIAKELGEKGPSIIHYHLKKAYQVIRRKWSLWGPPALREFTEVDEEEFWIFYDAVIECCKN